MLLPIVGKVQISKDEIKALASSEGYVGAISEKVASILSPQLRVFKVIRSKVAFTDVASYGYFVFLDEDGRVYLSSPDGTVSKSFIIDEQFALKVHIGPYGIVACKNECGSFSLAGNLNWRTKVWIRKRRDW
ncbi:hypothetical protein EYM_01790 [Ignicoccus islandicus DSM 13165]|uniref:Uncharacterized protein n=1 Tax=Ignicoccus islandicus DSM 13165 TaxID=940295 RepID=A0A0U3F9C9_9CREN|nr:hypothetical protein [Ignicoccus islandicus]ALU12249.1 hypothetical protein EYM_01790 [Ignicoccus islandicus DSM 13165]